MGAKCEKCGYNKNISTLEFHHLDPKSIVEILKELPSDFPDYIYELAKRIDEEGY